jgi:hypothetical protein
MLGEGFILVKRDRVLSITILSTYIVKSKQDEQVEQLDLFDLFEVPVQVEKAKGVTRKVIKALLYEKKNTLTMERLIKDNLTQQQATQAIEGVAKQIISEQITAWGVMIFLLFAVIVAVWWVNRTEA